MSVSLVQGPNPQTRTMLQYTTTTLGEIGNWVWVHYCIPGEPLCLTGFTTEQRRVTTSPQVDVWDIEIFPPGTSQVNLIAETLDVLQHRVSSSLPTTTSLLNPDSYYWCGEDELESEDPSFTYFYSGTGGQPSVGRVRRPVASS